MNRPKVVNLVLEDFGGDAMPIEDYIVDLEQEYNQLKSQNESLWETLFQVAEMLNIDYEWARKQGGKPSQVYRQCLAEHGAQVIRDFCSFALKKYRYDFSGFADEFNQLRQKAQENTNDKED